MGKILGGGEFSRENLVLNGCGWAVTRVSQWASSTRCRTAYEEAKIGVLPCVRYSTRVHSFHPHSQPMRQVILVFLLQVRKSSQSEAIAFSDNPAGKWYQNSISSHPRLPHWILTLFIIFLYCFSAEWGAKGGQWETEEASSQQTWPIQQALMGLFPSRALLTGGRWGLGQHEPHWEWLDIWLVMETGIHTQEQGKKAVTRMR